MTTEKRAAEMLVQAMLVGLGADKSYYEYFLAQIVEAEQEAVKNAVMTMSNNEGVNIAFKEGFAAAQAKAVEIVEYEKNSWGDSVTAFHLGNLFARIAEMKP